MSLGFQNFDIKRDWRGAVAPERPVLKLQSLGHYLSKMMTLCNSAWMILQLTSSLLLLLCYQAGVPRGWREAGG